MKFTEEQYANAVRKLEGLEKVMMAAAWMEDTGTEVTVQTMVGVTGMEADEVERYLMALETSGLIEDA